MFYEKRVSYKLLKTHRKTPAPAVFFNKIAGLRAATLLKKKLWHRCFPMNSAKFLRTFFLQNTFGRLLLILFVACFLYFPLSKISATKKGASCEKSWLVENRFNWISNNRISFKCLSLKKFLPQINIRHVSLNFAIIFKTKTSNYNNIEKKESFIFSDNFILYTRK